jgi:hypothetical protein
MFHYMHVANRLGLTHRTRSTYFLKILPVDTSPSFVRNVRIAPLSVRPIAGTLHARMIIELAAKASGAIAVRGLVL